MVATPVSPADGPSVGVVSSQSLALEFDDVDVSRLTPFLRPVWRPMVGLAIVALLAWGFASRYGALDAEPSPPAVAPQRISVVNGETVVTLDAAAQNAAAIAVAPIRNALQPQTFRAFGMVVDPQPISDLHNNYANAQAQLGMARAKLHQSQIAFGRSQRLLAAQADSMANRDAAEATYRVDGATLAAAQAQLQTTASAAQQNWGATLGAAILKGDAMFEGIAARQTLLIQATLSPGQTLTRAPQAGTIELENGTQVSITFLSDAPKTDARIQGASYFYRAPANHGLLPGMNVAVLLPSDQSVAGADVPSSAVVWWQGKAWVYVRTASTHFVRRAVAGDALAGDGHYSVSGLSDGTQIVTGGAQTLLSEEFRSQGPASAGDQD